VKKTLALLTFSVALASASNAAVALSGTALKNVQGTNAVDLVAGRLGLFIVDTAGDGFLTGLTGGTSPVSGNPFSSAPYNTAGSGLTINSTFGGDLVVARLTTAVSFGDTTMSGTLGSFTAYLNKNYAIVWFNTLTTAGVQTNAPAGEYFGIARGGDWTFPASDGGVFSFGTGVSNLDQIGLANGGSSSAATAASGQSVAYATAGTSLQFTPEPVPEPSAALLGALGALGFLRRRRN
jgi:MYXO-CTERM domain-containing protein